MCLGYWHLRPLKGVARSNPQYGRNDRTCREEAGTLASVCHITDTSSNLKEGWEVFPQCGGIILT